jgi:three-Cys-motif partner protein
MEESYKGREQTYLKHFFLKHYLERVGYVIGMTKSTLVYVDPFSGPWRAGNPTFEDTSFMIAIRELRKVREGIGKRGRSVDLRCVFVEKDPESFALLQGAIRDVSDLTVKAIPGEFENAIPEILDFIGPRFSLTFIDPTGWTGFALGKITPILQHSPGEVLINYMTDYMNRFSDLPQLAQQFNAMMGGPGFEGLDEVRKMEFYCDRVREAGGFEHVTSTRIKKPDADRSYFHLIYGTRHVKGLEEFRRVEEMEIAEQERVTIEARELDRVFGTPGQQALFGSGELAVPSLFAQDLRDQKRKAADRFDKLLDARRRVSYEDVLRSLLELPLVWEKKTMRQIIDEQREAGRLKIEGLGKRDRTVKKGCFLIRV